MAARGISSVKSQKKSCSFSMVLASAVLEWLLIFMLFIDAIFSYLVTKFSRYCKLQVPCLLCSRLDHVLGNEKPGFYWDLICGNHKLEISSLVLCHAHTKLVDVHGICENCFFSFATINKSNAETYRLLVGKLGAGPYPGLDQDTLLEDHKLGDLSTRNCSCCNEPWILRSHGQKLLQTKSVGSEGVEPDVPLSIATQHNYDDLKNSSEKPSGSLRVSHMGKKCFDHLSDIEYPKVKITSDTESEVPFDDDDDSALIHETANLEEDFAVQCVQMHPRSFTLVDDLTSEELIHPESATEVSLLVSQVQFDVIGSHGNTSVTSTAATGHGLGEFSCSQVEPKVDTSAVSKFTSFDEPPQSSNVMETPVEESTVCYALGTGEVEQKCSQEICDAVSKPVTRSEASSEINTVISNANSQVTDNLDICDAYKLSVRNKGRQLSGKLLEQRSLKDSARFSEDLTLLLSQISAARGVELPLNDMSPRVSGNGDELKTDSSGSIGMQILQKRISLERNESVLSLDGSIVSEIEGESEVDQLKRQVEHDKKLMGALYKEFEEERNASAVAVNQAMAMITRLQEEKAALHMEALQCLRMMEEQAEYDVEALQKANDLLAEKEREIHDLEAELEFCRDRFGGSTCDLKAGEVRAEHSDASRFKNGASVQSNSIPNKPNVCNKVDATKNSCLEFEDERLYILQCLKKMEKNLHLFSNDGANGEYSGIEGDSVSDLKELNRKWRTQESGGKEDNALSMQEQASVSEESPGAQEGCVPSSVNPQFVSKASSDFDCSRQCHRLIDVIALGDAVSNLIGRLEALEADRNSLEHYFKSLERGDEEL